MNTFSSNNLTIISIRKLKANLKYIIYVSIVSQNCLFYKQSFPGAREVPGVSHSDRNSLLFSRTNEQIIIIKLIENFEQRKFLFKMTHAN